MHKNSQTPGKKFITKEVLLSILKTGLILGIAVAAPGVIKIYKDYRKRESWEEYYPSSVDRITKRLYRYGIVRIDQVKGISVVKITDKGREEILKYDLNKLKIEKPKTWDGKWRLVIFDITEKYKKVRDIIRYKLKGIGFYQFQKSVFIYPYPCEKEIKYVREVLHVPHLIKLIRADRIENDSDLRIIFGLK